MKSREYVNTLNGLIYWLEDGAVMMRKDGVNIARQSNMTAETFFEMVGNDMMKLIEVEPKDKGMTMLQFTEFLSRIDKSATTATAQAAIQGGATHIAIDGNGDVFAFKMRPRHCLPDEGDANDYLGSGFAGRSSTATLREQSASWATLDASIQTGANSATGFRANSTFC